MNIALNSTIAKHYTLGVFSEYGFRKIYKANDDFQAIIGDTFLVNKVNVALGLTLGYQF